ncbi:MAG: hypothetical protein ACI363_04285 [Phocaeicola plebeius]
MHSRFHTYVVRAVGVIMLLLLQWDICAPLIEASQTIAGQEQALPLAENDEEAEDDETYYFRSGRPQLPSVRLLTCVLEVLSQVTVPSGEQTHTYVQTADVTRHVLRPHILFCIYRI